MLRKVDSATRNICDEQKLKYHLHHGEDSGNHHQPVRFMGKGVERSSNDTEDGVGEEAEGRDTKEDVIEVALFLGLELERLHPATGRPCHHSRPADGTKAGSANENAESEMREMKNKMMTGSNRKGTFSRWGSISAWIYPSSNLTCVQRC